MKKRAFISAIILCLLAALAAGAGGEDMPIVSVIDVQGLSRISVDVVRERISQPLGGRLSPETVSDDIKAIFDLGYFSDVRVEVEPFESGVRLLYIVKEKPSIRRVDVAGNKEIEDDKLFEKITISPGSIADTVLIKASADKIKVLYEEKGYPLAVIVPIVREIDEGHVLLTYHIEEGPKVKIRDIEIGGNKEISDWKIKRTMKTSEWWIFSWITSGGYYEKATLAEDMTRIRDLYFDKGFIQADVSEPQVSLSEDKKRMDIAIEVAEGEQFTISEIEFSGNKVFSVEELTKKLKSRPGDRISKSVLDRDVTELIDAYSEIGYALASVFPDLEPNVQERTAKIIFKVHEGDIYRVGRIDISGNLNTRDKVIRREIKINEGEIFNGKLLKRSYQRINNLNFFEAVSVKPVPHLETKTLDISVKVDERSTGYLNVGAGYSSVDRFIGMIELTQANLGGRGQYLKLKSEFGSRATFYELSFRDPWLFDRPVSFNSSLYNTTRDYTEYEKDAWGVNFGLGRAFWEYWSSNITYGFEEAEIFNVEETATSFLKEQEGVSTTSSVTLSVARDTRDNFLEPHSGTRNVASTTYAGLGGDNKFYKVDLESTLVIPVTERSQFQLKGRYSTADGLSGKKLPLYERYYVGGARTVRGLRDIGPRDEAGIYVGGSKRLIFNVDYIFPLIPEARLSGAFFYDVGTAYDSSIHMRDSAGVGIRWLSPIGPVKIEWAYNIEPKPDEDSSRFEFAIGTFF